VEALVAVSILDRLLRHHLHPGDLFWAGEVIKSR